MCSPQPAVKEKPIDAVPMRYVGYSSRTGRFLRALKLTELPAQAVLAVTGEEHIKNGKSSINSPPEVNRPTWQEVSGRMKRHREDTISRVEPPVPEAPQELPRNVTVIPRQLLSKNVVSITELPTEQLLAQLASSKLSSVEVTKAFLQRAGLANKLTNCITELLPEIAVARAQALDNHLAKTGKPVGILHGLPISVKEYIGMKGLDLNASFIAWVGNKGKDNSLILKLLWKAGAVFYVRTTEPQLIMHLECSTNIYGATVNPYNTALTSGGSSGGEGALQGLRGSCLGTGTDIGGSIRSPAANNGLYGLRPTSYRLPQGGLMATMLGEEQVVPVVGPLSTSLDGIKIFMRALIDQKPWLLEPSLVPMPWRTDDLLRKGSDGRRKLRIGLLSDDGVVRPHPPIRRGMETLVAKLAHCADIEIVDFPPYKHAEAWRIISRLYYSDGGREEKELVSKAGEPWLPLSKWILTENPNVKQEGLTIRKMWDLTCQRESYKDAWTRHWNSIGTSLPGPEKDENYLPNPLPLEEDLEDKMVDVILTPAGPGCAPPLGNAKYWGYTSQWNLLDYPALVFPTGLYCGDQDEVDEEYEPRNESDRFNHELYNPKTYVDAPISLQLVGRRYEDEKVVHALEMIVDGAGMR